MPHTVWKGTILFAGVAIPVKLSSAARAESLCSEQRAASEPSETKLFFTGREITKDDLNRAKPPSSSIVKIVRFTAAIDPTYFDHHYHVHPDGDQEDAYATLFCSLQKSGAHAIGQICMYRRETVAVIRAGKTGLLLHTLFADSEVRHLQEFRTNTTLGRCLPVKLSTFQPGKFHDSFRRNLLRIVSKRGNR
jgi:DNA end-binding protein Ku